MSFEKLLEEAAKEGLEIYEKQFQSNNIKGLYADRTIALNSSIETRAEKTCVLAEELGHHYTTVGNILDQTKPENRKQERRARAWAYNRLVGIVGLTNAYKHGVRNKFELAEYLGVSEKFIEEALHYYEEKYGTYYEVDNYVICFNPLWIMEKQE